MVPPLLKDTYTLPELARWWGIEPTQVLQHLRKGGLKPLGRHERITVAALDAALPKIMAGARYIADQNPERAC